MKDRIKLITVVGMAGAGKSTAVNYLTENKNLPKIYFGGIIYKAMDEAGIEITPESQKVFREEIRAREGNDFVIKRALEQVSNLIEAGQRTIVLDGLYTWSEYRILRRAYPGETTIIAVVAPRQLRYKRLADRPERPFNEIEAQTRDYSEIENMEKGGPIAIADYYLLNDGTEANLFEQIDHTLQEMSS